ncbi:GNAT family N-acetyltransferase [Corynebacterium sp.]|uniref:GNAT family N-acetyltransferase n=1 Tax=Corynebacterium sp. TaxID=1720 RepID=UPI0026DD3ABF|nr:GNAT family N-acetyltransferase [Corynebacterium sp.]MDO5031679.1 GNAT family N-acetyltransferase [Corynebacterium sp.]
MLTPLIVGRAGSPDHEEAVAAYVFSATLAIQDITGSAHSGVSALHVTKRLEGSAESHAHLFALAARNAPRPLGELGYPTLVAGDLLDVAAWVLVSLPLLEDTGVIEAHITLDASVAPLPGEPLPQAPWEAALALVDALSSSLSRPIRQIWVTGTAPAALPAAGFEAAFTEAQAEFAIPAEAPGPASCDVVSNMRLDPRDLPDLLGVLSSSSAHYPRGGLVLDTIEWDEQRFRDAGARLHDRGGTLLTALARDKEGHVVGLAEVIRFDSDAANLCELGLVYVLPAHRGRGHATALLSTALEAARHAWPAVDTAYVSYPAQDPAAAALAARLGAEELSRTTGWQKLS